ncbi:unnamed protein product [Urochloa decumbens]|uniref:Uncharacterized protein n=1 Tax=Urochloa decumbens TaxID=240449 RepID=A0ABC8X4Q5_9POAL
MYFHGLRAASSIGGGARLGLALGRRAGGAASAAARGRSISATSAANAPVPGDQGVAMEHPKQQQQPQVPLQDQDAGAKNQRGSDAHKTIGDVMSHSFGEGYSTRCEEEGFGGVYGRHDPEEQRSAEIHPGHPEYDLLQGSEVKEKEKARHHKDDKHAT